MKRTQVQIPDSLYYRAERVARSREWSVSELFRRAVEQYVAESGGGAPRDEPLLPEALALGRPMIEESRWRDLVAEDEARYPDAVD